VSDLRLVLAQAIRAERGRLGISQDHLAERLGWTRSMVTKVELGHRDISAHELPAICEALGVDLARLMVDADAADRQRLGI
jgi:transcriptional regulator with XRE-family HTH domain